SSGSDQETTALAETEPAEKESIDAENTDDKKPVKAVASIAEKDPVKPQKEAKTTTESSGKTDADKTTTEQSGGKTEPTTETRTTEAPSTTERPTTEAPATTEHRTTEAPTTEHTHNWVAQTKTVHHDEKGHYEVVKEAYDEEVPVYGWVTHDICRTCGAYLDGGKAVQHVTDEEYEWEIGNLTTRPLGYYTDDVWEQTGTKTVHHEAEKKWVVDEKAWDETVTTGYKCSICGAKK
ncbi:MAG: hypothetical protein ACI39Q_07155, partial [Wujia sp.]